MKLTPFEILLIAHLIGDFLFQTEWMALNKAKKWLPLIVHSSVYTIIIWIFAVFFTPGLSLTGILLIFAGHLILDRRGFIYFWFRRVQMVTGDKSSWLMIVTDQVFHLILIAAAISIA